MNLGVASPRILIRKSLCALIAQMQGFRVVLELDNPFNSLDSIRKSRPDILLIDQVNPPNGLKILSQFRALLPETRILLLSDDSDEEFELQALRHGARGFVGETCDPALLEKALRLVARGEIWVGHQTATRVIGHFVRGQGSQNGHQAELSRRQQEILALLADGRRNKEIANLLSVSDNTVRSHLASLYKKINVSSRLGAALYFFARAKQNGNSSGPKPEENSTLSPPSASNPRAGHCRKNGRAQ